MNPLAEAKRLAQQGIAHPDPAVRASILAGQRRWYRLSWLPTIASVPLLLAFPVFVAVASATEGLWWMAAAVPVALLGAVVMVVAFAPWLVAATSGWVVGPNLPQVPPAVLPLRVRMGVSRAPVALLLLVPPLMIVECVIVAIAVESARSMAIAMAIGFQVTLIWPLWFVISGGVFQPQVIIEAEGVRFPAMRVALPWEQVAGIRAWDQQTAGLAVLPRHPVRLPWWMRMSLNRSPWLCVPDFMMAVAVETVISTAVHARNARLQLVGEVHGAGRAGADT